jgi:DNA-binding Xre family transcriptional regulator
MMAPRLGYEWRLRILLAERGIYSSTALRPLLAEYGIGLSASQVWRLVTGKPERLNLSLLIVFCDMLDCTPSDLIRPIEVPAAKPKPKKAQEGPSGPQGRGSAETQARAYPVTRAARRCGGCSEVRPIERRARDGFPDLCSRCVWRLGKTEMLPAVWGRGKRECCGCAKVKKIVYAANESHGDLCGPCYVRLVDAGELQGELCGGCGKYRYIRRRGRDGEPDLCGGCYRAPLDTCHVCRRRRPCTYAGTDRAICLACKRRLTGRVPPAGGIEVAGVASALS